MFIFIILAMGTLSTAGSNLCLLVQEKENFYLLLSFPQLLVVAVFFCQCAHHTAHVDTEQSTLFVGLLLVFETTR